jgi:hypothetical protein
VNWLFNKHKGPWALVGLVMIVWSSIVLISDVGWHVWLFEALPIALGWRLIGSWVDEGKT